MLLGPTLASVALGVWQARDVAQPCVRVCVCLCCPCAEAVAARQDALAQSGAEAPAAGGAAAASSGRLELIDTAADKSEAVRHRRHTAEATP